MLSIHGVDLGSDPTKELQNFGKMASEISKGTHDLCSRRLIKCRKCPRIGALTQWAVKSAFLFLPTNAPHTTNRRPIDGLRAVL